MKPINVITAFCGRSSEDHVGWFKSAAQLCDKVVCVCHQLYDDVPLADLVSKAACEAGVEVVIIPWAKQDLVNRGFSELWNECISKTDSQWFMPMGSDEFIAVPNSLLEACQQPVDCIYVRLEGEANAANRPVMRCYRKSRGFTYRGLVHEEAYAGDGRHFSYCANTTCSTKVIHHRAEGPRGAQAVLLLRALFDPRLRVGTNPWWFDIYVRGYFKELLSEARVHLESLGTSVEAVIKIPLDWDMWRSQYDVWSFGAHQMFYDEVFRQYPTQRFGNWKLVAAFLGMQGDTSVVEIGGWDGFVASNVLAEVPTIKEWHNYEICRPAVSTLDPHVKLHHHVLDDWPWLIKLADGNAFVALHTLEHMKAANIKALLQRNQQWQFACIECPLGEEDGANWAGYGGTHILELGWGGLIKLFDECGFLLSSKSGEKAFFTRK